MDSGKMLDRLKLSDDLLTQQQSDGNIAISGEQSEGVSTNGECKLFLEELLQPLIDYAARTGALDAVDLCILSCVSKSAKSCINWAALKGLLPHFVANAGRPKWAVVPRGHDRYCRICRRAEGNHT